MERSLANLAVYLRILPDRFRRCGNIITPALKERNNSMFSALRISTFGMPVRRLKTAPPKQMFLIFVLLAHAGSGFSDSRLPEPVRNVGIDQKLNQQLPLDLEFRDENGRLVRLAEYFS